MKFVCTRDKLNEAIRTVSRAVAAKSNLAAIEGILLTAENETLTLTGYDFELGIRTAFECDLVEEGRIVLSSQLLGNIIRRMNSDTVLFAADEKLNCTIKGGNAKYTIKGIDAGDYPEFPHPAKDNIFKIDRSLFSQMTDYVIYAVSTDEKRPAHTGVLFKTEGSKLTMVALDGYRLAVCERDVDFEGNFSMIIPAKTMNEVRKITGESDGKISIYASKRNVMFMVDDYVILSRLLEGDFLDYRKAIPSNFATEVVVDTKPLAEAVERVSLIITERLRNPVRVTIADGVLTVKCVTELGEVTDSVLVGQVGPDIEIGFNNRFLLDALKRSKCDKLNLRLSGPLAPCKIIPAEGEAFTYLVLPVRIKE